MFLYQEILELLTVFLFFLNFEEETLASGNFVPTVVSTMTYIVSRGTLNLSQPNTDPQYGLHPIWVTPVCY